MGIQKEWASFLSADFISCVGIRRWQVVKGDPVSLEDHLPRAVACSVQAPAVDCTSVVGTH